MSFVALRRYCALWAALTAFVGAGCGTSNSALPDAGDSGSTSLDAGQDAGGADDAGQTADAGRPDGGVSDAAMTDSGTGLVWTPASDTTFYWDLTNAPPDNTKNVGAYDIDGWNNTAGEVSTLHGQGKRVVCYMDVGTYEPCRPDSSDFPASLKGNAVQGWPGEFWLDVRPSGPNYAALQAIMLNRFKVCQMKGFDAVEPDNLNSYDNNPGFPTSASDQLTYNEWVAATVHTLGLAVFQKNDTDQTTTLEPYFDGILDEECNKYSECSTLSPYLTSNKPAWNAEYTEDGETTAMFCSSDVSAGIIGALFSINLDGSVFQPCSNDVGLKN
jgi:hypothetical protein